MFGHTVALPSMFQVPPVNFSSAPEAPVISGRVVFAVASPPSTMTAPAVAVTWPIVPVQPAGCTRVSAPVVLLFVSVPAPVTPLFSVPLTVLLNTSEAPEAMVTLPESPSGTAEPLPICNTPALTETGPERALPRPVRRSVPVPALVRPPEPVRLLETVAVLVLISNTASAEPKASVPPVMAGVLPVVRIAPLVSVRV